MDVNTLISLLGERAGIPLALSESGTLALEFDGGTMLNLEYAPSEEVLHLYVIVGDDPHSDADRLATYSAMLQGNLFGHETAGAALALDDITGELMLTRRIELAVADVSFLADAIETLVGAAGQWKTRLTGIKAEVSSADRPLNLDPSDAAAQFSMRA